MTENQWYPSMTWTSGYGINIKTTRIFKLEYKSNISFCLHIGGGGGEKSACASSRCLATALAASSARPLAEKREVRERLPRNLGEDGQDTSAQGCAIGSVTAP